LAPLWSPPSASSSPSSSSSPVATPWAGDGDRPSRRRRDRRLLGVLRVGAAWRGRGAEPPNLGVRQGWAGALRRAGRENTFRPSIGGYDIGGCKSFAGGPRRVWSLHGSRSRARPMLGQPAPKPASVYCNERYKNARIHDQPLRRDV
jgi:hypothetical protein